MWQVVVVGGSASRVPEGDGCRVFCEMHGEGQLPVLAGPHRNARISSLGSAGRQAGGIAA